MNNKYATAVMAEQQNNFTLTNYDCDRTLFSQHDNNCLQHHVYQDRQAYIPVHNEVPTSSSLGYIDNRITANVSRPSDLIMHEPMADGWSMPNGKFSRMEVKPCCGGLCSCAFSG
jgi:hypothetical protein